MRTTFTELVGCEAPIQQAPMGSVSTPDLAAAVADAGGVGSITALGLPADVLDRMLVDLTQRTAGVLAVNFLTEGLDREALAVAAVRVPIIDFFWVDPAPELVEIAHAHQALVSWQVGSLAEAEAAARAGADVVVVQGTEAGGHIRGRSGLLPLLSSVLEAVDVPVLAAGGVADGRTLAAVLAAGAAGARMGTRFVATSESGAHDRYKDAVVQAGAGDTDITDAFPACPLCATSPRARVLSGCIDAVRSLSDEVAGETTFGGQPFVVERGSGLPPGASATGHIDAMAMYAGESASLIKSVSSVRDVVTGVVASAERLLSEGSARR